MIVYVETSCKEEPQAQNIINRAFSSGGTILEIDNYKNIFDSSFAGDTKKSYIIASVNNAIIEAPIFYGYPGKGFFLKNSLNCVFDCKYCYLQGIFKNQEKVFFVNYRHIKKQIVSTLSSKSTKKDVRFYSSDYSDNLATDNITGFTEEFIPFFDTLKGAKMEIRTKSVNISNLKKLNSSKNVEIAFSLSPQSIIDGYEESTPSLLQRIKAINELLDLGWQVGIRFMPLIACDGYEEIYEEFLDTVLEHIDVTKIYSIFIGGILFTDHDYKTLIKKQPYMDILYHMEKNSDGFYRQKLDVRKWFYHMFIQKIGEKNIPHICLDSF